jgi:hypothetical protein
VTERGSAQLKISFTFTSDATCLSPKREKATTVAEARGGVDDARRINGVVTARKVSRLGFQFVEGGGGGLQL